MEVEVFFCFDLWPDGTKKTIEQICGEWSITDLGLRQKCQEEMDSAVKNKSLIIGRNGTRYVFSKDPEGNYCWEPETPSETYTDST
ncbi:MAG TPA: hypothetical protein VJ142_00800 [Candidatus Nanoarchaeia archaeon]|nr:hypothetical protein [Candidatus Nanoarchaeia archaeon]